MGISRQRETVLLQQESSTRLERKKTHVRGEKAEQTHTLRLAFWQYLREVLEGVLALSIVSVIAVLLLSSEVPPHLIFCVFFFIILGISIRYHTVIAYIVSFLGAGCYGWLLWQWPQTDQSFSLLQISIESFLLFVSGIIVSETLRARRQPIEVTGRRNVQKEGFLQEIEQRCEAAETLNAELERQLVGQAVSVSTVSEKMARLWELQGQEQYNAILDIVMHAVHAEFCALYLLRNGRMDLYASKAKDISQYAKTVKLRIDEKDALIRRTLQSREVCTVRDVLVDSRPTQRVVAMMAGPLLDHRNEIVGVIIVDDIPLLKLLPTIVRLFGSLLPMISIAVQTVLPKADGEPDVPLPSLPNIEAGKVEGDSITQMRVKYILPASK